MSLHLLGVDETPRQPTARPVAPVQVDSRWPRTVGAFAVGVGATSLAWWKRDAVTRLWRAAVNKIR